MATIGQPSIATPNLMALKPVQQLADQVRERFKNIEAFTQDLSNRTSGTGQARDIQTLQAQVAQLLQQVAQLTASINPAKQLPQGDVLAFAARHG